MIAHVCELKCGEFIHTLGDAHIYMNHMDQVNEQLRRQPKKLPTMNMNPLIKNIFDFKYDDFYLEGYDPYPLIKAPVAV
jgi:thymidylate synthase